MEVQNHFYFVTLSYYYVVDTSNVEIPRYSNSSYIQ